MTAVSQTALRTMPPGIAAAADHAIQRLERADPAAFAGQRHASRAAAFRHLRSTSSARELATVQGAMIPWPYGGKQRQIMVDLEPDKLYALGHLAGGCLQCDQQPEPDPARRHGQDRHAGIPRPPQQPAPKWSTELNDLPIKTVERHDGLHQRRRPRQRRIHCRRPTWCTSTASGAC